ncbi:MAG: PEP-CTERM sorting domain-containing protein [Caldimonas sp.]
MDRNSIFAAALAAVAMGATTQAQAVTYLSDSNLADFTLAQYGTFTNRASLSGDLPGSTPTNSTIDAGNRVYGADLSPPILVSFSAPTSGIRVFSNIDHLGSAFDGYQYTILGSNDGISYAPLFNALTVVGSGEPFTLGAYTGTAPTTVDNVLVGTGGGQGTTGYIADFTFATAYKFYEFGASNIATQMGNPDQELSAVGNLAPIPEPETYAMMLAGLGAVGFIARRRAKKT